MMSLRQTDTCAYGQFVTLLKNRIASIDRQFLKDTSGSLDMAMGSSPCLEKGHVFSIMTGGATTQFQWWLDYDME